MITRFVQKATMLCLAVAVLVVAVEWYYSRHFGQRRQTVQPPVTLPAKTTPAPPATPSDSADAVRGERQEASKALSEASADIDQALKHIIVWNREVEPLRQNAAGTGIGQQPDLAQNMVYLLDVERPDEEELKAAQERIEALREEVELLAAQTIPTRVSAGVSTEISQLREQAVKAGRVWEDAMEQAQAIVRLSQLPERPEPLPKEVPLQVTIDQKTVEKTDHERRQVEADEIDRRRKEDVAKALTKEATAPAVKRALTPFLAHRYQQPKRYGSSARFDKVLEKQPMSLSRLQSMGALDKSIRGLELLNRVGSSHHLSQPRWSFPNEARSWNEGTMKRLQDAQEMLRKYGDTLVAEGLLSE